jgi:CHAT domain-containing protein
MTQLNAADEWSRLRTALKPLISQRKLMLEKLEVPTLEALQHRLQGQDIHILHFIGHGGFNTALQDGILLFEDEKQYRHEVAGTSLGILLRNHSPVRLVVVNACDGARSSRADPFAGVAQSLVQQGVPAVIAMQFEISDDAARIFAGEFYTALANGYPVDTALVEARTALYVRRLGAEWGTPVLFMRAPDGHIFDVEPNSPAHPIAQTFDSEPKHRRLHTQYS